MPTPGQLRIGIQRKDVPDLRQDAGATNDDRKDIPAPPLIKAFSAASFPLFRS